MSAFHIVPMGRELVVGHSAWITARTTAWVITVAAIAPIADTSTQTDEVLPVDKAKIVSPSDVICTG